MADERFGGSNGVIFTNVRILDGSGDYPYTGEVAVQGNRIRQVTKGASRLSTGSGGGAQTVIDGMGATLMPGLIDAHLHLSWNNAPGIDPIQMMPPEEHTLVTAQMAKLVLEAGFTAGRGAAAAKPRLDVVVRLEYLEHALVRVCSRRRRERFFDGMARQLVPEPHVPLVAGEDACVLRLGHRRVRRGDERVEQPALGARRDDGRVLEQIP